MSRRGRICFYSPYLYPVAVGGDTQFVGGTEVRQWVLARGLAKRGFDVMIATCDFGQKRIVVREGVTLIRTYALQDGIPTLRLLYPRLWKAMRTLHGACADVYLANGSGIPSGWAYDAARLRGSRFVFLASSDYDALRSLPWLTKRREKWWYLRALHGADARIAQTELQRSLFRENFALDTHVIPNPVELPPEPTNAGANKLVLWLSTYKAHKRPEWFTELAHRLPEFRFVMVGGLPQFGKEKESWLAAQRAAARSSNLEVHGFVEHKQIGDFLRRAALFVHTSPAEGFPMTLLEAWSYGIPSITTVDPGGTIQRHKIGEVITSLDDLVRGVATLMTAPDRRRELGRRARDYVERNHGPHRSLDPLAALLDRVIEDGQMRR